MLILALALCKVNNALVSSSAFRPLVQPLFLSPLIAAGPSTVLHCGSDGLQMTEQDLDATT